MHQNTVCSSSCKLEKAVMHFRFARSRCCPLCRTEAYQKRQVHDGKAAHKHRCAAQIQAAVRGFLARKWYRHLRWHLPPSNPCLTRKWAAEQLQVTVHSKLSLYKGLVAVNARVTCLGTPSSSASEVWLHVESALLSTHLSDLHSVIMLSHCDKQKACPALSWLCL